MYKYAVANVKVKVVGGGGEVHSEQGRLSEIYYWDRTLTQEIIDIIFTGFNQVPRWGLMGFWALEEGQGNFMFDSTAINNLAFAIHSPRIMGDIWANGTMYVNSTQVPVAWDNIPTDGWGHVHIEAAFPFSDDLNVMSRVHSGAADHFPGCLKEGSMIADEMDRVAANQKLTAIDTARYALQQPPLNRRNDVGAWKQAVNNARAQLEHQALRQEDQQASYQKEIESVNSERKLKQVSVGNSLRECEEEWQGLVSKNMQIDLACQELEKEIDQLKASQVGASEGPSDAAQGAESADSVMDEA
eukprot:gene984-1503_t